MGDPVPLNIIAGIADLSPDPLPSSGCCPRCQELIVRNRALEEALAAKSSAREYQRRVKASNAIGGRRPWASLADINRLIDRHYPERRPISRAGVNKWCEPNEASGKGRFAVKKLGERLYVDPTGFAREWVRRGYEPLDFESLPRRYI
jgi:hypothetical protein